MPDDQKPENTKDPIAALAASLQEQFQKLANEVKSGLDGQRSMNDRRFTQMQQNIARMSGNSDDSYNKPYANGGNARGADNQDETERLLGETDRYERARDRFERRHPQYGSNVEVKKRVDAIMADQNRRSEILTRDDFGRIDYDKAYRIAYLEARDQIAIEAEAKAAEARAQADQQNRDARATANLSGDVAEELPEGLTLDDIMDDKFTPEMMESKGLVPGANKHKPIVGV